MKKAKGILMAGLMSLALAACGQEAQPEDMTTETISTQASEEVSVSQMEMESVPVSQEAAETEPAQSEAATQDDTVAQDTTAQEATEGTSQAAEETAAGQEAGYEDNFAVDAAAAAAYGKQIKDAVANQDLEALADLTSFPVYIGLDGGMTVNSKEEFLELGAERIFTPELIESVGGADENNLPPSMAGFVLSTEDGPNIIFSVVDGKLAVQGINY